jgi:hypothetical protein
LGTAAVEGGKKQRAFRPRWGTVSHRCTGNRKSSDEIAMRRTIQSITGVELRLGAAQPQTKAKTWLPTEYTENTESVFRLFRVFRGPNARRKMHARKHQV